MIINDYIVQKFQSFGVTITEADLLDICMPDRIIGEGEINQDNIRSVSVAIAKFIPSLLLRPNVGENGFSVSYNPQGIKDYYSLLCKTYGIEDLLNPKPTLTFYE